MATAARDALNEPRAADAGQRWLEIALGPEERAGLAKQGFIAFHTLPSGKRCAKLRYRDFSGRQRVRYLGTNPQLAAQVAAALKARQRAVRRRQASIRMARCGRRALREVKCRLESPLRRLGWHFHGLSMRRRRLSAEFTSASGNTKSFHLRSLKIMDDEFHEPLETGISQGPGCRPIFDELRRSAMEHPDPAQAVLQYAVADLMDMSSSLCRPIKAELQDAPDQLAALEDLTAGMEMMLKVSRQADRFWNVALKHEAAQTQEKAKKCDLDTYAPIRGLTAGGSLPTGANDEAPPSAASRPR